MRVLGLVPARGGSKRIPRKNIALLNGRPLIWYTLETAVASGAFARLVVSTDDPEIAAVAASSGAEVPFLRPPHLAGDTSRAIDVVLHALSELDPAGASFDAVMLLQPTHPFRTREDICGSISVMAVSGCDSVISVVPVEERHPAYMVTVDADGHACPWLSTHLGGSKAGFPPLYVRDGTIYLVTTDAVKTHRSLYGPDTRVWHSLPELSVNVNTLPDLEQASWLIRAHDKASP